MASAHHTRGRSRDRSGERTIIIKQAATRSVDSTPKAGSKRLFSNRESRQLTGEHGSSAHAEPNSATGGGERHSDKRHRSSDWPLPNPSPSSVPSVRHHLHNRKTPNSPSSSSHRSRDRSLVRSSKFLEGSMNDRVSQVPPVPYLEPEDELLSEYNTAGCGEGGRCRKRSRMFTRPSNTSVAESSANQSDASRSSSLFRFGKSIAATFNPNNWKFWGKEHEQQQEEEDEEVTQLRVLQERQAKAERIYQELKESGHFRDSAVGPRLFTPASEKRPRKHDSGIEVGDLDLWSSRGGSTSLEEKRKGRVFLEPPRLSQHGESPGSSHEASVTHSNASTPKKFNFKKPSLANLKKASLSNIKSTFAGDSSLSVNEHHQARRIPSRKDLHKQQKLVKRVSNLEERLKQARQKLSLALNEPMPSESPASQAGSRVLRSKFVPGALSSLPSERLLSGYVSSEADFSDEGMGNGIGQAVSTDLYMSGGVSEQSKDVTTGSKYSQGNNNEESVMQSVEDGKPTRQESTLASIGNTSQADAADLTPTKPKDTEMADYEDEELTPKPKVEAVRSTKPSKSLSPLEATKKRKSIFERIPDDGGDYNPSEAEEEEDDEDLESDIISEVSSITKLKTKSKSSSTSKISHPSSSRKGPTLLLQHPRKVQKTRQGPKNTKPAVSKSSATKFSTSVSSSIPPPTRTAPPPPPPSSNPSIKKLRPHQLKRKAALPPQTERQQSASPPPSSTSFTAPGSGLVYNKPTRTHKVTSGSASSKAGSVSSKKDENEKMNDEVPPMPTMPKSVRLASGEVVKTEGMVSKVAAAISGDDGDGKRKKGGVSASASKQSFEWPDDVF
ncbi:uncharacterized protein RAG0_12897 [Rhynchosporium agropyri]|uniref:Nuclear RNA binding protein n=1 Tax=Rhynchosporium agropyri TaxID=914238 RepID=A0A1E1LAB1_9HELO|nr:uncharacterized protein RAG0_12897 [Rhynchosporium agropyri]